MKGPCRMVAGRWGDERVPESPWLEETLLSAPSSPTHSSWDELGPQSSLPAFAAEMEPPRGGPRGWEVLPSRVASPSGHSEALIPSCRVSYGSAARAGRPVEATKAQGR